jgi:hypothetical protein
MSMSNLCFFCIFTETNLTMIKLYVFLAAMFLTLAYCSNDDKNTTYTLSAEYLKGTWVEIEPEANYIFDFDENTAKLIYRRDSSSQDYNYTIQNSYLNPTVPGSSFNGRWEIEIINRTTFKLSFLYPQFDCDVCQPIVSTFVKQ